MKNSGVYLILGILLVAVGVIIYKMVEEKKATDETQKKLADIKSNENAAAGEFYLEHEDLYDMGAKMKNAKFGKTA